MTLAWQSPLGIESNERRSSSRPTWTKWAHAIRQREKKTNWQTLKLLCCIQLWVQFLSVSAGSRANLSTKRETIHQRESRKITLMHVQPPHGNYNAKRNESTTDKKKNDEKYEPLVHHRLRSHRKYTMSSNDNECETISPSESHLFFVAVWFHFVSVSFLSVSHVSRPFSSSFSFLLKTRHRVWL